jgi:flagellar M-ring protein FliF
MDNAVALPPAAPAAPATGLASLALRGRLLLGAGIAALVVLAAALLMWNQRGDYKVLYANLSDKDGGAILAQLSQMNVPYRHADGGGAILVPSSQVHDVRLKLASAGLPKGSIAGFELMDNARFGQTQFQERLTFQRGLEGELVRSITSLAAVQSARVHLALPQQNGFFREQQKPSASVLLTLHPGRTLDRAQVAGIVHLVSSSVPELNPRSVSVLDQTGTLLSGPGEGHAPGGGLDAHQLQYVAQIEAKHVRRILDLLEPVVGRDNLRAQVSADVDFSQTEATHEEWKPNQGQNAQAAVRSSQFSESGNGAAGLPSGVPGAASNQPPVPATAPINGSAQALQAAQGGTAGAGMRRDSVTNYELDKTVRMTRAATGIVKRLNAAVVVNHRAGTDAKGRVTTTPLPAEELAKLETLVKESIGFSAERGDSVKVINAPFRVEKVEPAPAAPFWREPELFDLLRSLAVPALLALVALAALLGLLRPALKAALPAPAPARGGSVDAVVGDSAPAPLQAPQALPAPRVQQQLDGVRGLAKENPAAVANILRSWVNGEAA